jgi:hypothetical protein
MYSLTFNMKKLIIAAFICFTSLSVTAQKVALSRVAELNVPGEAKPVSREKLYTSQKSSNFSVIAQTKDRDNVYEIGNILIKVIPNEGEVDKTLLAGLEADYNQIKSSSSFFKLTRPSIANAKVICAQYELDISSRGQYSLTAVNLTNTKSIGILIEYDIAERDKADRIFERILKSIIMKN